MVRYYGYYSNVKRGRRKNKNQDEWMPFILESEGSTKEYRKNWAKLIQKIYQVDPLTCAKCGGRMKILSFIEDPEIIKKILKHLDLWDLKSKPLPRSNAPPNNIEPHLDYSHRGVGPYGPEADSQLPLSYDYLYGDEQYPEGPSP